MIFMYSARIYIGNLRSYISKTGILRLYFLVQINSGLLKTGKAGCMNGISPMMVMFQYRIGGP